MKKAWVWALLIVTLTVFVSGDRPPWPPAKTGDAEIGVWSGNTTIARLSSVSRYRICNSGSEYSTIEVFADDERVGSLDGGNCIDVEGKTIELIDGANEPRGTYANIDAPTALVERIRKAFCTKQAKEEE
jgi:hypothetical protein